jgi:hypothetical protein
VSQHAFKMRFTLALGYITTRVFMVCPMDMLHTIYLGIFTRLRDGFFQQIGPTPETAHDINALARSMVHIGKAEQKVSPKSKFSKGIMVANLWPRSLRCTASYCRHFADHRRDGVF